MSNVAYELLAGSAGPALNFADRLAKTAPETVARWARNLGGWHAQHSTETDPRPGQCAWSLVADVGLERVPLEKLRESHTEVKTSLKQALDADSQTAAAEAPWGTQEFHKICGRKKENKALFEGLKWIVSETIWNRVCDLVGEARKMTESPKIKLQTMSRFGFMEPNGEEIDCGAVAEPYRQELEAIMAEMLQ